MKFWHLFKEASLAVLDNLFYLLSFFIPKNPDIWLFGSMFGAGYADNSKYFFEYVCRRRPEIRAVWYSANADVVTSLRQQGYEAYRFYEPAGIAIVLRAGAAFISHSGVRDIRPFAFTPAVLLVNLWHGIPLKKIALDDKVSELRNKPTLQPLQWLSQLLCPGFRRQADVLIAASAEDQRNFSTAFALPLEKITITGYPRNDVFFRSRAASETARMKTGIYVPTFRGKENSSFDFFAQFGFDVAAIDQRLAELNVRLYLKLHHFNFPSREIQQAIRAAKNIVFYDKLDAYEDLPDFDFLITDFSSIYFDFLLSGRPIIFAPFDKPGFEGTVRQLYYDYEEVTPGPKAQNWPEVLECIAEVLQNAQPYAEKLNRNRARFHRYADGHSCERVYDEVQSRLLSK
ncbi:CDP-glycerol glycerophosphotransferase family protein [Desulfuromonas thiophila]|uniref:CDP-glycerol glycerophosphotransferase family protein n=1 Tax=Desulfuromonas thiophila TaxID=57664 RepID=UPI0029F59541|nr:CDP-glycerol glycerophosphotransferase family protein [Desulfuromonas thiophila]